MSDSIITVENLSKKYVLSHKQSQGYTAMRDVLSNGVKNIGRKLLGRGSSSTSKEDFWALKDINFEIKQGDRVGIIGRNGAGKSTLLKILSRITEPTTGRIHLKGRVASLLEVGTGFHPELTGRENIFLNGAIMGMSKWEIKKKFDEIVAFAEVEKFLDTPVKRYSSGMYVRLAFAVAAHLEPEILVVDEVLAVGDAQFQKKCLGKMEDVGKEGRTVLFVSHNMGIINSLCNKVILLDKGEVLEEGGSVDVIQKYFNNRDANGCVSFLSSSKKPGDCITHLLSAKLLNGQGEIKSEFPIDEAVFIEMEYEVLEEGSELTPNFHFKNACGDTIFVSSDTVIDYDALLKKGKGIYKSTCSLPANFFNDGTYFVNVAVSTMKTSKVHFFVENELMFTITDPIEGIKTRGNYVGIMQGVIRPELKWELVKIS